jgi:hypothetical protein
VHPFLRPDLRFVLALASAALVVLVWRRSKNSNLAQRAVFALR